MTIRIFLSTVSMLLIFCSAYAQNEDIKKIKHTISGYVTDSTTGENLIGAYIIIKDLAQGGVTTNEYGFYSISLPTGTYQVTYSYLGYYNKKITVILDKKRRLNMALAPSVLETQEVLINVEAEDQNIQSTEMSKIELPIEQIKTLPALFGEVDILKTIQLLPGVQSAGEGNSGFYVRGGGPDQNLILLDEAVVYNTGHLFGFFSVFNADAINNTILIKGGMPANYGGRLSSVVDISMKDGNDKKFQADGGIGTVASRLTLQGPIKKNKSSFIVSGRRTYIDVLLKPFTRNSAFSGSGYYFYDVNAKVNYRFSDKDRIYLSGYFGRDVFSYRGEVFSFDIPWGNATTTFRWNHLFNDKLFMNTSLIYNSYNFEIGVEQEDFEFKLFSGIKDFNVKIDLDYYPSVRHSIKFGTNYIFHTFIPDNVSGSSNDVIFNQEEDLKRFAHEAAVYVLDDFDVTPKLKINAGLRLSYFSQVGPFTEYLYDFQGKVNDSVVYKLGENVVDYTGLEPRLSLRYKIDKFSSVKASYTVSNQYVHMVSNAGTTLPTDLWVGSSKNVKPQIGTQYAIGYFRNFRKNTYESSLEFYYKDLQNQLEFRDGYVPDLSTDIEKEFVFGKGWSYGMEVFFKRRRGKLNGWIGYTLSRTMRQFEDLNDGKAYPYRYDRTHDFSIVAMYKLNDKWTVSSTWIYGTGIAFTVPIGVYFIEGNLTSEYIDRNSYRLVPYHRGDISATYKPKTKRRWKSSWVFSVYNVYNRHNPYFVYFDVEGDILSGDLQVKAKQVSLFPIIPSITYNFNF